MELTDGVRLSSPDAFLLLWVIPPLVALFVLASLRRRRTLLRFAGDRPRLHAERRNARPLKGGLLMAAVVLIVVALARPGWTPETRTVERRGRDVVFVVDVSRSMLAQDLAPNRLQRAKLAIVDTLEMLRGDRVALVAFAGTAVVKSPLTFDYGFVRLAVERLSTDSVSRGGTLIGDALRVVRDSVFGDQASLFRDVVLITDGGDLGSLPLQAAGELGALGARIIAVGLGDEVTGQPIPDPDADEGYLQYDGQPVLTTLDAQALRELAGVTPGGRYVNVATGNFDLGVLYTQLIAGADRQLLERTEREVFQERFQPFPGRRAGAAGAGIPAARSDPAPPAGRQASGRAAPASRGRRSVRSGGGVRGAGVGAGGRGPGAGRARRPSGIRGRPLRGCRGRLRRRVGGPPRGGGAALRQRHLRLPRGRSGGRRGSAAAGGRAGRPPGAGGCRPLRAGQPRRACGGAGADRPGRRAGRSAGGDRRPDRGCAVLPAGAGPAPGVAGRRTQPGGHPTAPAAVAAAAPATRSVRAANRRSSRDNRDSRPPARTHRTPTARRKTSSRCRRPASPRSRSRSRRPGKKTTSSTPTSWLGTIIAEEEERAEQRRQEQLPTEPVERDW